MDRDFPEDGFAVSRSLLSSLNFAWLVFKRFNPLFKRLNTMVPHIIPLPDGCQTRRL